MLPDYRSADLSSTDDQSIYNLNVAYTIACERLSAIDIEEHCHRSDSGYQATEDGAVISVSFLNRNYQITLPDITFSMLDGQTDVDMRDKILIMHYLIGAKGTSATGKLITFRELPGGIVYYPTFTKRTMQPIAKHFGYKPDMLISTAELLGGQKTDMGDASVIIHAFNRVPVTLILWQGDEEFTPEVNLLFDSSITDYLESEDITVMSEILTWRLVSLSRKA